MVRFSGPAFVVASLVMAAALHAQQPQPSQPVPASQPAPVAQPAQPQSPAAQPDGSEKDPLYVLDEAFARGAVQLPRPGILAPVVLRQVRPTYTPEAMRHRISGEVELRFRIGANGVVEDVRVLRSLDRSFGLDREAARVARLWLFRPATDAQQGVTSLVDMTVAFHLG